MLSHGNLLANARAVLARLDDGQPWVYLHAAPMYHIADGQFHTIVTACGGAHVFLPRFSPEAALDIIVAQRVSHTCLVPTMLSLLAEAQLRRPRPVSSLRAMVYGGAPITPAALARVLAAFPGCALVQGYGLTEAAPNLAMGLPVRASIDPHSFDARRVGRAVPGVELQVCGANGDSLPPGQIGEIVARGAQLMEGYWGQPSATAAALRDGWLHTGDAGILDSTGTLTVVGRLNELIITAGHTVAPAEVEAALGAHPGVAQCAVFGVPDRLRGEAVYAVAVGRPGATLLPLELRRFCGERLAAHKCPRAVEVRAEPLPNGATGKVDYAALRTPFWQAAPGQDRLHNPYVVAETPPRGQ